MSPFVLINEDASPRRNKLDGPPFCTGTDSFF